jgi:hypothetical protein
MERLSHTKDGDCGCHYNLTLQNAGIGIELNSGVNDMFSQPHARKCSCDVYCCHDNFLFDEMSGICNEYSDKDMSYCEVCCHEKCHDDGKPKTEPEQKLEPESEPEQKLESKTEPEQKLEPESEPEQKLEPKTEPEQKLEPESEPEQKLEPETKPEPDPNPEPACGGSVYICLIG